MYSLYNLKYINGAFTNSWTNNVHNLLRELGLPYMMFPYFHFLRSYVIKTITV